MVQTMAHTCYRVANLKESVKFYTEAFDFVVSRERDFPEYKFTLVYLTLPGSNYELGDGYGHIAISVEDLEALYEKHKAAGYDVTDLKGLPGFPPSYYFIKDPDGYKIEVIRTKM